MKIYISEGNTKIVLATYYKYFKRLESRDVNTFYNDLLITTVDLIGEKYKDEIKGTGGYRHKGFKKIIAHCKKEQNYLVSVSEIKALFQSNKNLSGESNYEIIRLPFAASYILKSIVTLAQDINQARKEFSYEVERGTFIGKKNCRDVYLPKFYEILEMHLYELEKRRQKDGQSYLPIRQENRLKLVKSQLDDWFVEDCF